MPGPTAAPISAAAATALAVPPTTTCTGALGKFDEAKRWLRDERPEIREWAAGVVENMESMLKGAELREAEERFRH